MTTSASAPVTGHKKYGTKTKTYFAGMTTRMALEGALPQTADTEASPESDGNDAEVSRFLVAVVFIKSGVDIIVFNRQTLVTVSLEEIVSVRIDHYCLDHYFLPVVILPSMSKSLLTDMVTPLISS